MLQISKADLKGKGDNLSLHITVTAPTLGWKVELSPYVYIKPPEDGIQEIELTGTPPTGVAGQSLENHELSINIDSSDWLQGVSIKMSGLQLLKLLRPVKKQDSVGNDYVAIDQPGIRGGDKLIIPVRYGGGCKKHKFQLNWDGMILESAPPQVILELTHDSNDDNCRALISEDIQFDLSVLEGLPESDLILRVKSMGTECKVYYE